METGKFKMGTVTIKKAESRFNGRIGEVFHRFDDGRVNARFPLKEGFVNVTLEAHEFVENEEYLKNLGVMIAEAISKAKLTKDQKKALSDYERALSQEDRYLGSVFVTPAGQKDVEKKTADAYNKCKALGMTHEHGL